MFRSVAFMVACAFSLVVCVQVPCVFAAPAGFSAGILPDSQDSLLAPCHPAEQAAPGIRDTLLHVSGTEPLAPHAPGLRVIRLSQVGPALFGGSFPATGTPVYSIDPCTFCVVIMDHSCPAGLHEEWIMQEGIPGKGLTARDGIPMSASQPAFMVFAGLGLIGMATLGRKRVPAWYARVYDMREPALPARDGRWKDEPVQAQPAFQSEAA